MLRINRVGLAVVAIAATTGCQTDLTAPVSAKAIVSAPLATITFDPFTGTGFVGKGDVQLFYGWNNQKLQQHAAFIDFQYNVSETTSWTCTKTWYTGPNQTEHEVVQVRQNSTSIQGLLTTEGRNISQGVNGPNTGFIISPAGALTVESDGPAVGSCPAQPSGFVYDGNAATTSNGGGLQITVNGGPGPFVTQTAKNVNTWYSFP